MVGGLLQRFMVDFVYVNTRILIVKFKYEKVKVHMVLAYGSSERNVEDNQNDAFYGVY